MSRLLAFAIAVALATALQACRRTEAPTARTVVTPPVPASATSASASAQGSSRRADPPPSADPRAPMAFFVSEAVPGLRWKADPPPGVNVMGPTPKHAAVIGLTWRDALSAEDQKRAIMTKEALRERATACVRDSKDVREGTLNVEVKRESADAPSKVTILGLAVLHPPERACLERAILATFPPNDPASTLTFDIGIFERD